MLAKNCTKSLKDSEAGAFMAALIKKENKELERLQNEIHKFTLKFDYRNRDMELGTAEDAPVRTIEKISGYIRPYEEQK